jgi:3-hydroxybutyryl-CoA dehydrogenase
MMQVEDVRRIAVIGAGTMGHGIAQEFARAGYTTAIVDQTDERLTSALANVRRNLRLLADVGLVQADAIEATVARLRPTTSLADAVADADVVIEAVFEDLRLKQELFARLDELCPAHTLLASNSSSIMPSQLAPSTSRPDRVLVAHYFNPPHLLPLVEVVKGPATSDDTAQVMFALLKGIGKSPVIMQKEAPGFIANRMQVALQREALSIVEHGYATPADIDTVVRASFGRRLAFAGPFEIADIGGLDVISAVAALLIPEIESSTDISAVLTDKPARGDFGVKSGKGFYDWPPEAADELRQRIARGLILLQRQQLQQPQPQREDQA